MVGPCLALAERRRHPLRLRFLPNRARTQGVEALQGAREGSSETHRRPRREGKHPGLSGGRRARRRARSIVNKAATIDWLRKWNVLYDTSYDNEVSKYRGRKSLGLNELEVIYGWKYRGLWPAKEIRALRSHVADRQARDWTRRALACPDDLGALCIAGLLAGAGPGGASAVLMAADPIRFTVM